MNLSRMQLHLEAKLKPRIRLKIHTKGKYHGDRYFIRFIVINGKMCTKKTGSEEVPVM